MMKSYTEIPVPATSKRIEQINCDICGYDISQERRWNKRATINYYDHCPDFEPSEDEMDICVSCMEKKVLPLIRITFGLDQRK